MPPKKKITFVGVREPASEPAPPASEPALAAPSEPAAAAPEPVTAPGPAATPEPAAPASMPEAAENTFEEFVLGPIKYQPPKKKGAKHRISLGYVSPDGAEKTHVFRAGSQEEARQLASGLLERTRDTDGTSFKHPFLQTTTVESRQTSTVRAKRIKARRAGDVIDLLGGMTLNLPVRKATKTQVENLDDSKARVKASAASAKDFKVVEETPKGALKSGEDKQPETVVRLPKPIIAEPVRNFREEVLAEMRKAKARRPRPPLIF